MTKASLKKEASLRDEKEFQKWRNSFRAGNIGTVIPIPADISDDDLRNEWMVRQDVLRSVVPRQSRPRAPQRQNPDVPEMMLQDLHNSAKGGYETVRLKDLQPIPERDLKVDPVDPAQLKRLKDSINHNGFWGGVVCCRIDQKIYVAAG
jgi:hypothetical protein